MDYKNYFDKLDMPEDFHSFAEKAIEIAGKTGERKRDYDLISKRNLARSNLAETERRQIGETKRRTLMETGATLRRNIQETGLDVRGEAIEQGLESRHLRRFGPGGIEERKLAPPITPYQQAGLTLKSEEIRRKLVDIPSDTFTGTTPGVVDLESGIMTPFRSADGSNKGVVVSIKRNPKTGEIVHLDARGRVIKRIKNGKIYYPTR